MGKIILALLLLGTSAGGQEGKRTAKKGDLKGKIVLGTEWEMEFDQPVVDISFGEEDVTSGEAKMRGWKNLGAKGSKQRVRLPYPKVVFVPRKIFARGRSIKEIRFYDSSGKERKKVMIQKTKRERVISSPKGKYLVIARRRREEAPTLEGGVLYRDDGLEVWRKDQGPVPLAVSDEGYVVASHLGYGEEPPGDFVLYDPKGKELKKIKNPLKNLPTGWGSAKFSDDGNYVVLRVTDISSKSVIICMAKNGEILWQKELNYLAHVFRTHSDAGIFGGFLKRTQGSREIYVYRLNWEGEMKWKTSVEIVGGMKLKLSQDGKRVFGISPAGYLWAIDVASGEIMWSHKEDWSPTPKSRRWPDNVPEFEEIEVGPGKIYVKGTHESRHAPERAWYASTLFVFDAESGELLGKRGFPNKRIMLTSKGARPFILDIDSKKILSVMVDGIEK